MSADPEDFHLVRGDIPTANPRDLEAIVQSMEIAAISLSPRADSTFTFDELLAEMRAHKVDYAERDVRIVLASGVPFLRRVPGQRGRFALR